MTKIKSETGLQVKEVNFNGASLMAAQVEDTGNIYAGIKWVCEGIGLSDGQMQHERKRLKEDLVLKQGERDLVLPTNGGIQSVLCIDIEFLPLWLAKISITPSMKRNNSEMVAKLVNYQLKAKEILANAFLRKQATTFDMLEIEKCINNKFNEIQTNIIKTVDTRFNALGNTFLYIQKQLDQNNKTLVIPDIDWKTKMYRKADEVYLANTETYSNTKDVLRQIYLKMNKVYGVVWEQEQREFKDKYSIVGKANTMELISDKNILKDLFESILSGMSNNDTSVFELTDDFSVDIVDEDKDINKKVILDKNSLAYIIQPLIEKYNDKSANGAQTYNKVYKRMNVKWSNRQTRYMHENNLRNRPSKAKLIGSNDPLMRLFKKTVKNMISEE